MATLVLLVTVFAVLTLSPRLALASLITGSFYLTKGYGLDFGGVSLHYHRLLLAAGIARVFLRGEGIATPCRIDHLVLVWAMWSIFASFFHVQAAGSGFVYTVGYVFNICSGYFIARCLVPRFEDLPALFQAVAWALIPIGILMILEKSSGHNLFGAAVGGSESLIRDGKVRAQGPFRHPILAGTVGAALLPIMLGLWRTHRAAAVVGALSCIAIVLASNSSGPLVSMVLGLAVLFGWRYRGYAGLLTKAAIVFYVLLDLITTRPAYYTLLTKLDLTGSSTAYYRAHMIDTATKHLSEWWAFGTDFTAHWIPSGIGSIILSGNHMDITNYYIGLGIGGGLTSMLLVLALVIMVLQRLVIVCNAGSALRPAPFFLWCLGAGLFSFAISGISVAFFDQSENLFWILLSLTLSVAVEEDLRQQEASVPIVPDEVPFTQPAFGRSSAS